MTWVYLKRAVNIAFFMGLGLIFAFVVPCVPLGLIFQDYLSNDLKSISSLMLLWTGFLVFNAPRLLWENYYRMWRYAIEEQDRKKRYLKQVGAILLGRISPPVLVILMILFLFGMPPREHITDIERVGFCVIMLFPLCLTAFLAYNSFKEAWTRLQNFHVIEKNDHKAKSH